MSNTLTAEFCVEALEEALAKYGKSRFSTRTRAASSRVMISRKVLLETKVKISMDGKGRYRAAVAVPEV